eukprot:4048704-Alexandrium_andersonii.AAC.1
MSASLVGSEMCIRDSARTRQPAAVRGLSAPLGTRQPAAVRGLSAPLEAVSYTHLTLPTICSV